MNSPLLLLPPAVNVLVTGIFTAMVLRQYLSRHRIYQLYWSIALSMAFLATLAYIVMVAIVPTSQAGIAFFRIYYILGGVLMPAWLGMGSIALVGSVAVKRICFNILILFSLIGTIFTLDTSINIGKLSTIAGTPGTGILQAGPWLVTTIILNTLGVVAIGGVAIYSGWKLIRRQSSMGGMRTSTVLWANILILLGAILNGAAGSLARFLGIQNVFWLIMAFGWIVLFGGVALASRRSHACKPPVAPQDATHTQSTEIVPATRQV